MATLYETLGKKYTAYGTPERTALANSAGIKDYKGTAEQNAQLVNYYTSNHGATSPAKDAYVSNIANEGSNPTSTNNTGGVPTGTDTPKADPFSAYRKYLTEYQSSLSEPEGLTKARTSLADISGQIDQRDLESRREYEGKLDESGGTVAGAQQSAAMARRRSNSELADLAVRQSGAARNLEALSTGQTAKQQFYKTQAELAQPFKVGDHYYDPTTGERIETPADTPDPFNLSPGQSRYAYDPATGSYKQIASVAPSPRAPTQPTVRELEAPMKKDVSDAAQQLIQIVRTKGFKGVSPDDYQAMADYLMEEYGYEAVIELDDALRAMGTFVDRQ